MHLDLPTSRKVATRITAVHGRIQDTIIELSHLSVEVVESERASNVAPAVTQKALTSIASSLTAQLEMRQRFIAGQAQLVAIKGKSDLEVVDFGCLGDGPVVPRGLAAVS